VRHFAISLVIIFAAFGISQSRSAAQPIDEMQHDVEIVLPGAAAGPKLDLAAAMRTLHIGAVDIALIDRGRIAWSRHFGRAASNTIYQAASLSKLVTAVAALRLVERGALDLDRNVNDDLIDWRVPDSDLTRGHPVTLRGLLSMTAGVGVPLAPRTAAGYSTIVFVLESATHRLLVASNSAYEPATESVRPAGASVVNWVLVYAATTDDPPLVLPTQSCPVPGRSPNVALMRPVSATVIVIGLPMIVLA